MAQLETQSGSSLGYKQELKRTLSFKDLVIFGLVTMLPIAPAQVYGMIAPSSFGMTPLVYLVGILAMLFTALSYSKMSAEFPYAGSVYSFVQRGLNPHIGFVTGWLIIIDYILVPALLYSFAGIWISGLIPSVPSYIWVIVFLIINTYINVRGVSLAAKTNFIFLIVELFTVFMFLWLAIKYVFIDGGGTGGFTLAPLYQADKVNLSFLASAASIAVLGFLGFDSISTLSEEVKNPKKTVGKATIAALVLIGALFMAQAYMAALVQPNYADLHPDMAFFDITRIVGGEFLYFMWIMVGVAAVGIANALTVQAAISRILFSMGRDKLLPFSKFLGQIHPKHQTPANATYLVAMLSVVIAAVADLETIIKYINFGALTSFMILHVTVVYHFFFRKKERSMAGIINYLLFPLIGFLVLLFVWMGFDVMTYVLGFSWLFIGVLVGYFKSKGYKEVPPALKEV
ncbi:amino acid permease [Tumebacillus algifaecis]|uniref:Amino acid permease n=1 Tax=Tumebacillus algifaecis TaxID=1214604 RepID=A0A223D236_9BACL|nr:APC family permease [Tumebacillus algifaecis]ASS75611.1 amino acid permease [Tumebacillus algifaecis]